MTPKRLRERRDLRARCAVFNETDHGTSENAPHGWCEIQRDDSAGFYPDDAAAALAVALAGGAEGTAMHYETGSGLMVPINVMSSDVEIPPDALDAAEHVNGETRWICIVPRVVAKAAGLLR